MAIVEVSKRLSGDGGQLTAVGAVTVDDVLYYLMSRTVVPSALGAQLDRMRSGQSGSPGSGNAAKAAASDDAVRREMQMLRQAAIYKCVADLEAVTSVDFEPCPDMHKFARQARMNDGQAVVGLLRAYQTRSSQSEQRALADTAVWMLSKAPNAELTEHDESVLAQSFREGKQKRARGRTLRALADAQLVLARWVVRWNRKRVRVA